MNGRRIILTFSLLALSAGAVWVHSLNERRLETRRIPAEAAEKSETRLDQRLALSSAQVERSSSPPQPGPSQGPVSVEPNPPEDKGVLLSAKSVPVTMKMNPQSAQQDLPATLLPSPPGPLPQSPSVSPESEKPTDLFLKLKLGVGAQYLSFQQSGVMGDGHAAGISPNQTKVDARAEFGAWSVEGSYEHFTLNFNSDTGLARPRQTKEFQSLSLKPGYGPFFVGLKAVTAPVMYIDGQSIDWSETSTVSALFGFRSEKQFVGSSGRPFHLGFEIEGSSLLSVKAQMPLEVSGGTGYGVRLSVYAEKRVSQWDQNQVWVGVQADAKQESTQLRGRWQSSEGEFSRSNLNMGSLIYLGLHF